MFWSRLRNLQQHVRTSTSACTRTLTTTHRQVKAEYGHESLWENEGKRFFMLFYPETTDMSDMFLTKHERLTDPHESIRHRTKVKSPVDKERWWHLYSKKKMALSFATEILHIRFLMHMDHFLNGLSIGCIGLSWTALRSTDQVRPRTQT